MANDAETILGAGLEILAVVVLFVLLDRGWPPWGASPAALLDSSTAVLAVVVGAVAGVLTLALVFKFDRTLVAFVVVVVPLAVSSEIAVRFVLELEGADAVRELVYFGYTVTATVIPLALALAFDSSADTGSD